MACLTSNEVLEIMSGCTLTSDQIDPYIVAAESFINNVFSTDLTITAALKKELTKWLTAHMIASIHYRTTVKERVGEAEVSYSDKILGQGFNSTPYGQMLLQLDTTGKVALTGKKSATIYAIPQFDDTDE
jgi:hypothetical protein